MLTVSTPITGFLPWEQVFAGESLSEAQEFTLAQEYAYLDDLSIRPDEDRACGAIAAYIGNGLNHLLRKFDKTCIAVRDIEQYDAVNPDLSRFPLVKCYRTTETHSGSSRKVSAVIAYCLTFPDQDQLPGVLSWVSAATNRMLRQYAQRHQYCPVQLDLEEEYRAEYRIMVNEVSSPVYAFLRFNFSFTESNE
jgi:hypothetical protein